MRTRRYIRRQWIRLLKPILRYSYSRHAFVLRGVGGSVGPVLRTERRRTCENPIDGVERRRAGIA